MENSSTENIISSAFEFGRFVRQKLTCDMTEKLNIGQIHVLIYILENPGASMKDIATLLHVTSPSATVLMDRLVALKFVERHHDAGNRRVVRLRLTPAGLAFIKEKMAERRKLLEEILRPLSDEDRKTLEVILKKIIENCPLH